MLSNTGTNATVTISTAPKRLLNQQKTNNRNLRLPFINGSEGQKERLLNVLLSEGTLHSFGAKSRKYLQPKRTIFVSLPKLRKGTIFDVMNSLLNDPRENNTFTRYHPFPKNTRENNTFNFTPAEHGDTVTFTPAGYMCTLLFVALLLVRWVFCVTSVYIFESQNHYQYGISGMLLRLNVFVSHMCVYLSLKTVINMV